MKLNLLRFSGATLLTLLAPNVFSQIVGGNAYLQSDYIEMGINPTGVYISETPPPAGYQSAGILGIIADSDKDGWEIGSPGYCGDYFAPGSPEEGFAIQANGLYYYNTYNSADAAGSILNHSNNVTAVGAIWRGTIAANGLQVTQITSVPHGGSVVISTIQLKNTSAVAINQVFYSRNADPDNQQEFTGDFTTENIVVENHPVDDWAIVSASGLTYCYLAMASMQSNAMASWGSFSTADMIPSDAWSGTGAYSTSGSTIADIAIQMTFKVGKINPGQTKVLNFIYGTNEADLDAYVGFTADEVVTKMEAQLNAGSDSEFNPEFKISPNPTSGLINLYGYGMNSTSSIELQIVNMVGQVVSAQQLENSNGITSASFELNSALENGTYFANFIVDGKSFAQPFVLNR